MTQSAASAAPLRAPACLASRFRRGLCRLLDRDQTQGERDTALTLYPDRPIDQSASRRLAQLGDKIEIIAFAIEPACALPAGPDHEVCAGFEQRRHAVRLQIGAIGKPNLARHHRYPVQRLAGLLIGQFEVAKALLRKIERAVNAPHLVPFPGVRSFFRHRGGVDDPDQAATARFRSRASKRLPTSIASQSPH